MAEVIGLIASCAQIAGNVNLIVNTVRDNVHTTDYVKKKLYPVCIELLDYKRIVESISTQARGDHVQESQLHLWRQVDKVLRACEAAIEVIANRVPRINKGIVIGRVIDDSIKKALADLETLKPVLLLTLQLEQSALNHATSEHVRSILAYVDAMPLIQSTHRSALDMARRKELCKWLYPVDYNTKLRLASDTVVKGALNGQWLIKIEKFQRWLSQREHKTLLIIGPSGTGKTVLATQIIRHLYNLDKPVESSRLILSDPSSASEDDAEVIRSTRGGETVQNCSTMDHSTEAALKRTEQPPLNDSYDSKAQGQHEIPARPNPVLIAHFFFDFSDPNKQTTEQMIRCLMLQIARQDDKAYQSLQILFKEQEELGNVILGVNEWASMLRKALNESKCGRWHVIIDALDECTELPKLLETLHLVNVAPTQFRLLLTSQDSPTLQIAMKWFGGTLSLVNHTSKLREDISSYVLARLDQDPALNRYSAQRRTAIHHAVIDAAGDMYRLAKCHLDELSLLSDRRPTTIAKTLTQLPRELDLQYSRLLDLVEPPECRALALKALLFIAFSVRPVTISELAEYTAFEYGSTEDIQELRFDDPNDVLELCRGLVIESEDRISLAHKSLQDFLIKDHRVGMDQSPLASIHRTITINCLGYIRICPNLVPPNTGTGNNHQNPHRFLLQLKQSYPLLEYAASLWPHHAQKTKQDQCLHMFDNNGLDLSDEGKPNLWKYWVFLQPCHLWDDRIKLACFLYHAQIASPSWLQWCRDFWPLRTVFLESRFARQPRQKATSTRELSMTDERESTSDYDNDITELPDSVTRHVEYHLAIMLIELSIQKNVYDHTPDDRDLGLPLDSRTLSHLINKVGTFMGSAYAESIKLCCNLAVLTLESSTSETLLTGHADNLKHLMSLRAAGFRAAMLSEHSHTLQSTPGSYSRSPRKILMDSKKFAMKDGKYMPVMIEDPSGVEISRLAQKFVDNLAAQRAGINTTRPITIPSASSSRGANTSEWQPVAWSNTVFNHWTGRKDLAGGSLMH